VNRVTLSIAAVLLLAACRSSGERMEVVPADEPAEVAALLAGWFDSSAQAAASPDDFFDIRLVMIRVWTKRSDGHWLYVEQAAASALDRPYRQRVYRVHRDGFGVLRSDVYTLPGNPLAYAACWTSDDPLAGVTPDELDLREGCSIILQRAGASSYAGSTEGHGCLSTLRGATYATSEVTLEADRLVSWDRGWNDAGDQVWGATAGGYEFIRRGVLPP
jgi:hypothetical protein